MSLFLYCFLNAFCFIYHPHLEFSVCIYPTLPPWAGCDTRSIFKRNLTGLNLLFPLLRPVTIPRLKNSLPYYLTIAGRRTWYKHYVKNANSSSRILTPIAMSMFYDDNPYTMSLIYLLGKGIIFAETDA